ncbi:hypothetical protein VFES401_15570 [Aliivibrio fischeri]|uniref:hypothetical protein n=1 Tax=Aliivibrio fischeri TaxID=668 RepID=UPI00107EB315|nr:hypothetical protein [Aliivibrio fischeri]MUH97296.1 hypothetical protein [Aliivibrio fischeri]MUI64886.1 hypothetical protein [Aliivibrio fischeri]TGA68296.1 hypothetical protein VFES401_15570 [Aliivibrio fischeri]
MSHLTFTRKPMPVIPEQRPMYKIAMILLVLKICSSGSKSSLLRLHLFNWALFDEQRFQSLVLSAERKELIMGVWGVDPSLNMALALAVSEQLLVKENNGSYKITPKGDLFITESKLITLFDSEVLQLKKVSKKITEAMVKAAAKRWENEI